MCGESHKHGFEGEFRLVTDDSTLTAGKEDTAYTITKAQLLAGFSDGDSANLSISRPLAKVVAGVL